MKYILSYFSIILLFVLILNCHYRPNVFLYNNKRKNIVGIADFVEDVTTSEDINRNLISFVVGLKLMMCGPAAELSSDYHALMSLDRTGTSMSCECIISVVNMLQRAECE